MAHYPNILWQALVSLAAMVLNSLLYAFPILFRLSNRPENAPEFAIEKGPVDLEETSPPKRKFRLTMGLRRPRGPWLLLKDSYSKEHFMKRELQLARKEKVLGCTPSAESACKELLSMVAGALVHDYSHQFQLSRKADGAYVNIVDTGEAFKIDGPMSGYDALETASRLAMEDLNILIPNANGDHELHASATCFPVGWSVDERLGYSLINMHQVVPHWQEMLYNPVERFLSKVGTELTMERNTYFIQAADPSEDEASILCQNKLLQFEGRTDFVLVVRYERQTFRRLPVSRAIVFTVNTTLKYLSELQDSELERIKEDVDNWPEETARYKGKDIWMPVFNACYEKRRAQTS